MCVFCACSLSRYYDADSNLFGYRKSVCEADLDPSVNHLWITSAAARDWGYSTSTDDDEDTLIIEPGTTLTLVIYWSWKGTLSIFLTVKCDDL